MNTWNGAPSGLWGHPLSLYCSVWWILKFQENTWQHSLFSSREPGISSWNCGSTIVKFCRARLRNTPRSFLDDRSRIVYNSSQVIAKQNIYLYIYIIIIIVIDIFICGGYMPFNIRIDIFNFQNYFIVIHYCFHLSNLNRHEALVNNLYESCGLHATSHIELSMTSNWKFSSLRCLNS